MHVGLERNQLDFAGEGGADLRHIGWIAGRNVEAGIGGRECEHSLAGRAGGEVDTEFGGVLSCLAIGRVVDFEDNVGALAQELAAILPGNGHVAGLVAEEEFAAISLGLVGSTRCPGVASGDVGDTLGGTLQVAGSGWADEGVHVVDYRGLVDFPFGGADPLVLWNVRCRDQENVFHDTGFSHRVRWHFHD